MPITAGQLAAALSLPHPAGPHPVKRLTALSKGPEATGKCRRDRQIPECRRRQSVAEADAGRGNRDHLCGGDCRWRHRNSYFAGRPLTDRASKVASITCGSPVPRSPFRVRRRTGGPRGRRIVVTREQSVAIRTRITFAPFRRPLPLPGTPCVALWGHAKGPVSCLPLAKWCKLMPKQTGCHSCMNGGYRERWTVTREAVRHWIARTRAIELVAQGWSADQKYSALLPEKSEM
jgi:hypothetical protein